MRVFIPGIDGYLGWALAQHLLSRGHQVAGADSFFRRQWVDEMGSWSAIPIVSMDKRLNAVQERTGEVVQFWQGDLCEYSFIEQIFETFQPEAIVHLGECPSAPYSMIDVAHATFVQCNNVVSTLNMLFAMRDITPDAHMVKLGTMGEYGTPNVPIPEGFFDIEYRGQQDRMPFPRQAGSLYHQSKVHSSNNIMLCCKIWGISVTDIMQGVVFGTRIDGHIQEPAFATRLDFDQAFGTVINRFCCQAAIGHPLTLYGIGGQKRGFLTLRDSMQCLTLALENPARAGEYRVFNQLEDVYSIAELAKRVQKVAAEFKLSVEICNLENPRAELEEHIYQVDHQHLLDLGYQPTQDLDAELRMMMEDLIPHRERIMAKKDVLIPDVLWTGGRRKVSYKPSRS